MKLYYPKQHYNKAHRGLLFPLLKPFIKTEGFTDVQRMVGYGVSEKDFQFTEVLEEADMVVLTMAWNYYIKTKQEALAIAFVKECAGLNKKVIAFNAGDFGVKIPYFKNLIILRPSGYKSKFTDNEYAFPALISDPLKKYYQTDKIVERPYSLKPVIGFCGQANPSIFNAAKEVFKTSLRNLKNRIGRSKDEVQQILSTSFLRASVLKTLKESTEVETNFILRKKYRAGVISNKNSHKTTLEFYNNLRDSDYVVCIRGAGNFSVRFYEALAMGRIPIFINTDCALPFDKEINWKKHVVWVEYKERNQVAQKVKKFHEELSGEDFIDLQQTNRNLWETKLTLSGFFNSFLLN
ncbi:Exostosin family protein [Aequorivita sublithincola DSM 14238]|uniref:Exostosin family protein n=1 Tax=Aequorivita sublithincola (strain DSM 14238 / LMG 21431 / ACAM 643 / 9-3) TaxID=746697 RepID=I3YXI9_AEQSU|nr:exostosin family protein [Aequorivita sublithincola]AFL81707.1 Exostosin family protein [Aequorivita sublithincola DSM 14238]